MFRYNPDPRVAFDLFGMEIFWYGIIITLSIIVAFLLALYFMKKMGFREEIVFELLLLLVPLALVGARLWYVIVEDGSLANFFNFRDGGLAIYGAIVFGSIGLLIYTLAIRKCSFFAISDVVAIVLILAQSIGRWGNYFNQELYGFEVGFHFFPITVMIGSTPHLALFFYESVLNLIGFVALFTLFMRPNRKYGTVTAVYFIIYGVVRAILEPLRMPVYQMMIGPIPVSIVLSVLAVGVGILLLVLGKMGKLSQKDIALRPKQDKEETKKKK